MKTVDDALTNTPSNKKTDLVQLVIQKQRNPSFSSNRTDSKSGDLELEGLSLHLWNFLITIKTLLLIQKFK